MRSSSFLCILAIVLAIVFASGCTSLSNELGLDSGKAPSGDGKGVGYGPSGSSAAPPAGGQNQSVPPAGSGGSEGTGWESGYEGNPSLPPCGSAKELFAVLPLADGDFVSITPLGNLNPPGHTFPTDHVYFYLKQVNPFVTESAFLISPADMRITGISSSEHVSDNFTDYDVDFAVCREFSGRFGHVASLSAAILQNFSASDGECSEYEIGGKRFRRCAVPMMMHVSANEVLGSVGGNPGQYALDMWAFDARAAPLNYANKARWYGQQLHVVCPLDYFKANLKSGLEGMIMDSGGSRRTALPSCGSVEQDEPGTAQGAWFVKGTKSTYPEDPHVALVHDVFDPAKAAFSIGTSMQKSGLDAGVYFFQPESFGQVSRDFGDVRPDGKAYCFEATKAGQGSQKYAILIQMTAASSLRMERLQSDCGDGPWAFTESAADFER